VNGVQNQTVVDGSEWAGIKAERNFAGAEANFEASVEEFFAPLLAAAEEMGKALEVPTDELEYLVISEGVEATAGQEAHVVRLSKDSQVLRLIEDGNDHRLVWVGDDLEIMAEVTSTQVDEDEVLSTEG
jgi:methyl coenzyme M reductase beta subunit